MNVAENHTDAVDRKILACYRDEPMMSAAAIGRKIKLSENAVRKRTQKLIDSGILSFGAIIDYDLVSSYSLEAYIEVFFPGDADVHKALQDLSERIGRREIREAMTLVGDVDALIRVRVRNVSDLRELVSKIRSADSVVGTKTRIVAGRWWHGSKSDSRAPSALAKQGI